MSGLPSHNGRTAVPDSDDTGLSTEPVGEDLLTWHILLGRWIEFARSAVALPQEGDAGLVRESVADIIALQAVWFALQHLDELNNDQRALGVARSQVLIERHAQAIRARWAGDQLPSELTALIDDAQRAVASSGD